MTQGAKARKRSARFSVIWGAILLALVIALVVAERHEIAEAWPILLRANLWVLVVTVTCECLFFVLQAVAARLLFGLYQRPVSVSALTATLFVATMINEVLPTSGVSGTAGFIYWCDRLGYGLRDSLAVNIWMTVLSYLALVPVIAVCLRALSVLPGLPGRMIVGMLELAAFFLVLIVLVVFFLYRFVKRAGDQQIVAQAPAEMANQRGMRYYVRQRIRVALTRVRQLATSYTRRELSKEWRQVRHQPWPLLLSLVLLVSIYAVRVVMLWLCMQAIGHDLSWSHALFVYCLTLMFSVVSLAPTTLGVVEVALTTALSWFGIPLPAAVAATVLYRLSSFWFPIPAGLLCQWSLGRQIRWRVKSNS